MAKNVTDGAALLTVPAVADYLSVPVSWVYRNHWQLPAFRVGKQLRFRRSDIDRWLEGQREGALA